jgi:hypothetical protein
VAWKSKNNENEFYTLVFTNLDGHLKEDNAEVLHWFMYVNKYLICIHLVFFSLEEIFLVIK